MSLLLAELTWIAASLPWGAAAAWLWLRGMHLGVRASMRRSRSRHAARMLARVGLTAALLFAPALLAPPAVIGALVGFVFARNALLFRETRHAD
jgi:hypothetical protein